MQSAKTISNEENEEQPHDQYARTHKALKWAKGGIAGAKLYIYAKTGHIEESEDSLEVTKAFERLHVYGAQIDSILCAAENWSKSMNQTWTHQTDLIYSLNVSSTVIPRIDQEKYNKFGELVDGISNELNIKQKESEKKYKSTNELFVIPLRNMLHNEIKHALDMKKKYIQNKRQFDNCCTAINNLKNKIQSQETRKTDTNIDEKKNKNGRFGKLKYGFGKLMHSNASKQELENKLSDSEGILPEYKKSFDEAKKRVLESIEIVEHKLNNELIVYIQQFYSSIFAQ